MAPKRWCHAPLSRTSFGAAVLPVPGDEEDDATSDTDTASSGTSPRARVVAFQVDIEPSPAEEDSSVEDLPSESLEAYMQSKPVAGKFPPEVSLHMTTPLSAVVFSPTINFQNLVMSMGLKFRPMMRHHHWKEQI